MGIIEIISRVSYKTLERKTKEWLILNTLSLYDFLEAKDKRIKVLEEDLAAYKKRLASVASSRNLAEHKLELMEPDKTSWFYKNCKRQRKNEAKICQVCPFRQFIEDFEGKDGE